MSSEQDPEHELCTLVDELTEVDARRIRDDLDGVKIPAVVRAETYRETDPDSGDPIEVPMMLPYDEGIAYEIVVPEAFVEIAHEVTDVKHLERQGNAATREVIAGLDVEDEEEPYTPRALWWRSCLWIGGISARTWLLVYVLAMAVVAMFVFL